MQTNVVAKILNAYGIAYRGIKPPTSGYRNYSYPVELTDGTFVNLIIYKNESGILARIKNAHAVANFTARSGLPTRTTYDDHIIQMQSGTYTRYAALYHYLPGNTIPWEAYTMAHLKALGKAMGDMHAALSGFADHNLPDVAEEQLQLNKRMQRYFAQPGVKAALSRKLDLSIVRDDFRPLLTACKKLPNQKALHMDFVRGNILFKGTTLSGIIDFEKAARGHIVFDIARTLAFLLVDCKYKPEEKVRKYFLYSGYQKYSLSRFTPITHGSVDVLEELMHFFLLHDLYKFLRHNPYEFLPQNEHFTRTKTLLLKRGLLGDIGGKIR